MGCRGGKEEKLLSLMTGSSRCHRRKKMMGRGAEGGCGTEEKPCPVSRVSAKSTSTAAIVPAAKVPAKSPEKPFLGDSQILGVDLYSQALKALSERSPFDSNDVKATTVSALPSALTSLLLKHSDSRKRHKKSHGETKSHRKASAEKPKGSTLWVESEEYFRQLNVLDIEKLHRLSSSLESLSRSSCFTIPVLGNPLSVSKVVNGNVSNAQDTVAQVEVKVGEPCSDRRSSGAEEDSVSGHVQSMEIDVEGSDSIPVTVQCSSLPQPLHTFSSTEWVLGSRNKVLLTTERPSKKRKLLGVHAGLERLIVTQPCDGSSTLCHFCSTGDSGDQLNRLVVCKSCHVAIHHKCYGIQGNVDKSWVCSWCKQNSGNDVSAVVKPCVLCPKSGGALKHVQKAGEGICGSMVFAHLFCSLWMPEVYVDDMRLMEPIVNVEGIKDTRRKLVCNVCKVRHGTCVRCTNGACRTSFHPICARESGHRLEIWGKFGSDDVELRAFCAKHSEASSGECVVQGVPSDSFGIDLPVSSSREVSDPVYKLPIGLDNAVLAEASTSSLEKRDVAKSPDVVSDDCISSGKRKLSCRDLSDAMSLETLTMNTKDDASTCDSVNIVNIVHLLKKLIDREKFTLDEIASDVGASRDSLAALIAGDQLASDLRPKLVEWLKGRAYIGSLQDNSCDATGADNSSHAGAIRELDTSDVVSVKSVPPRRRTMNNPMTMEDDSVISACKDKISEIGGPNLEEQVVKDCSVDVMCNGSEKIFVEPGGFQDLVAEPSTQFESKHGEQCKLECRGMEEDATQSDVLSEVNQAIPACPSVMNVGAAPGSRVHPLIKEEMKEMQDKLFRSQASEVYGQNEPFVGIGTLFKHDKHPDESVGSVGMTDLDRVVNLSNLDEAKKDGFLNLNPDDEVEGEILYLQHRLLRNAVTRKFLSDNLIGKIVKNLPREIDSGREQKWDVVLVNRYLYELRQARKQGRKERRHKEAQAVLEAANAASPRISLFRKDAVDEISHQQNHLKLDSSRGRGVLQLPPIPQVKATNSSFASPRSLSARSSDFLHLNSRLSKDQHPRSCDVCRRSETLLNPILVCSGCKVTVHLDCYRSVKGTPGPWCCELCEEQSSSKCSGTLAITSWEKPCRVTECALCGASDGAFRKSSNGQWVHAFCAEWVFESTFQRGQVNLVQGMETLQRGNDVCSVCQCRSGVCIKCNYGHCQSMFHPTCARSAGYFMSVKYLGRKLQHKAYCEKHSVEQKAKAETQKHGVEELNRLRQVRAELERLRLLCERIVKREKLKKELVLCSHDIHASKRDAAVTRVRSPPFAPEVSSESATTSLKGDGSRSYSESMQRSDDVTVDSAFSSRPRIKLPVSMENDQKTDDSSTSQRIPTPRPAERVSFGGKQIPLRALTGRNIPDSGGKRLPSRKHAETFEKELVMTSDQATVKNQRLPKGYIYVPLNCLPSEKQASPDSIGREEQDD